MKSQSLTSIDSIHSEPAAFFSNFLIRFYYEHLKFMFKNDNIVTLLEYRYVLK